MIELSKEVIKADVLVVGGGIAGLMAAIAAKEKGAEEVVIAEKANTKRSGSGATGNDHFLCYIPSIHGDDMEPIVREVHESLIGGYHDDTHTRRFLEMSFDRVKSWDDWGIEMRPTGDWEFMGHAFPGRPRVWLKYAGHNQKPVLTRQAKKCGVKIVNHLPITEVIVEDGRTVGAIGLDVSGSEPVMKVVAAKTVILATGSASRLYPPQGTPGQLFNVAFCPACTGGAQAIAYRAGANLVNLEFPNRHAGPKFFARCGKSSWIGLYKDPKGTTIGPFVTKPTRELGDITADVWNSVFTDMMKSGRGPAYIDCTETSKEDIDYMIWSLEHEGNTAMLNYMEKEGIDVREHMVEFMQYEPHLIGRGVDIDIDGQSSVPGLYAAGDPVGNFRADIAGAAVYGWIAGEAAADKSGGLPEYGNVLESDTVSDRLKDWTAMLGRTNSASWQEANMALQQLMRDYAGVEVRSETLLKAGIIYMDRLRGKIDQEMQADDAHSLMRCLETLDLLDCGEALMHAALERKETRAMHRRSDFPFTNPLLTKKFLTVRRENGKPVTEWRART